MSKGRTIAFGSVITGLGSDTKCSQRACTFKFIYVQKVITDQDETVYMGQDLGSKDLEFGVSGCGSDIKGDGSREKFGGMKRKMFFFQLHVIWRKWKVHTCKRVVETTSQCQFPHPQNVTLNKFK